jgi:hypothetical protein
MRKHVFDLLSTAVASVNKLFFTQRIQGINVPRLMLRLPAYWTIMLEAVKS